MNSTLDKVNPFTFIVIVLIVTKLLQFLFVTVSDWLWSTFNYTINKWTTLSNSIKLRDSFSSIATLLISFLSFRNWCCLSDTSVSNIGFAVFHFNLWPPLLIDKLTFANVGIMRSLSQLLINDILVFNFTHFTLTYSYKRKIFSVACPYFFPIRLKILRWAYNLIINKIIRSFISLFS